jgi:hypothetical protein
MKRRVQAKGEVKENTEKGGGGLMRRTYADRVSAATNRSKWITGLSSGIIGVPETVQ